MSNHVRPVYSTVPKWVEDLEEDSYCSKIVFFKKFGFFNLNVTVIGVLAREKKGFSQHDLKVFRAVL